ncbi:hypothetical protein GMPD_02550 [Geomonas paludis]|uniref:Uncharacterized protein n=1 Tax=Geomonas paludis TaxID=2740185 RepID=A0A6V8MQJ2_9BACT|nr:hypothetical protein GMPD_02550 [Geomonas paludis]
MTNRNGMIRLQQYRASYNKEIIMTRLRPPPTGNTPPRVVGKCPICCQPLYSGTDNFYCHGLRDNSCDFRFYRRRFANMGRKTITDDEMQRLLNDQIVDFIGLTWKGKTFDKAGFLCWKDDFGLDIKLWDRGMRCLTAECEPTKKTQ